MTGIGQLVECKEDMEITNLDINFHKGVYYTALLEDEIYVIDRKHKNIKLPNNIFKKHFKLKK
jgi:hypothetical protein